MVTLESIASVRSSLCLQLDNGEKIWLKKEDLDGSGLAEGSVLDEEEFRRFVRIRQYPRALNRAIAMLARRPCSKGEIVSRLRNARFAGDVTELVIYKLEKEKLLDDREFCEQWVRYRISCHYGPRRIIQELKYKGIPEQMAREALEKTADESGDDQPLLLAQRAWKRAKPGEDPRRARQRVISALVRRGFDWDTAKRACEEAEKLLPEDR